MVQSGCWKSITSAIFIRVFVAFFHSFKTTTAAFNVQYSKFNDLEMMEFHFVFKGSKEKRRKKGTAMNVEFSLK